MDYQSLVNFLKSKMRMSHIYQPVMIKRLLESGGLSHQDEIAKAILQYDETQLEYYVNITNNMVGKVLRNHGIVDKEKKISVLPGYEELTKSQVFELIALCAPEIRSNKIGKSHEK